VVEAAAEATATDNLEVVVVEILNLAPLLGQVDGLVVLEMLDQLQLR
jgi:hypothetical protein